MIGDYDVVPVILRPAFFGYECEAKRCGVCGDVYKCGCYKRCGAGIPYIGVLVKVGVVDVLAVANRPAIVFIRFNYVYFIRWQIVAQIISSHFGGVDFSEDRIGCHEDGIAKSFGVRSQFARVHV